MSNKKFPIENPANFERFPDFSIQSFKKEQKISLHTWRFFFNCFL